MSVLNRIAHFQNRRDEVSNQELRVLEKRMVDLSASQATRVRHVINQAEKLEA